jgi:hypothetical protein
VKVLIISGLNGRDVKNKRRDGFGGWDSLGERALRIEVVELENAETIRALRHLAAWKKRKGI